MYSSHTDPTPSWLTWFLRGLLLVGFCVLLTRLAELQVIKGSYYRDLADNNRIRRVPIIAPRGVVYARDGEELVTNKEVKRKLTFNPQSGYVKSDDISNASDDEIITEYSRYYPLGAEFAHVSGYVGEVTEDEVGKVDPDCSNKGPRKLGSYTGRGGLEQQYGCTLRGIDGEELIEVDSMGRKVRIIGRKNPQPGTSIHTTIDFGLQKKVAESMSGKKGAVIVTNGKGELLALYSAPSYDPNLFSKRDEVTLNKIYYLLKDPSLPLFNRAIGGAYHPGSVFKIITASAALEDGKIDKNYLYDDQGIIKVNEFSYTNWYFTQYGKTEGEISLPRAIARSTDTLFYKLGELVGVDRLYFWASQFGLTEKTSVDLPGEIIGIIPNADWKQRVKGEKWFLGNTYHMAIGQGDVTLTPLQVNTIASIVAQEGKLCRLHVLSGFNSTCRDLNLKNETLTEIREGMIGACSPGGTAFPFFDFKPQVACKTGTAETEEKDKTHAWFNVFAPADNPQIVVTVLVEKGGEGSYVAAPIAKEILSYYFNK